MRVASLDGLRGAAAFAVVLSHIFLFFDFPVTISWSGQTAVQVFFVLSGFLMATHYLGKPLSFADLETYARRRVGRVVPLYIAVVIASFVLTSFGYKYLFPIDASNVWQHLFFMSGIAALWAVPVEVHFYVAFPLLWLAFSYNRLLGCAILLPLIPAMLFGWLPWIPSPFYYAYFLGGIAVSFIPARQLPGWVFPLALAGIVPALPGMTTPPESPYPGIWTSPYSLVAICFLLHATRTTRLAGVLLGNSAMTGLGKISYSLYLLHGPVMMVLLLHTNAKQSLALFSAAVIVLSLLAAALVHVIFEEPLRRAIANGRRRKPPVDAGPTLAEAA